MIEKIGSPIALDITASCLEIVASVKYDQGGMSIPLLPNEENNIDLGYVSMLNIIIEY